MMKNSGWPGSVLGALVLVVAALDVSAQENTPAPGSYRCASYNVSGGGGSCRTMQPLVLRADQTYQYASTQGRWSAQGGVLQLSQSGFWGPGQILGRDTLRFDYDYRGWHHTVTWICQACGADASSASSATAKPAASTLTPQGGYRGVSLTLEFGVSVRGVSGFTLVPVESAATYTHNAALPEGAVQGLARELGATSVALSTSVGNKLRSGRRYAVFLAWPRETLQVATFELPPGSTDYQTTLAAALR